MYVKTNRYHFGIVTNNEIRSMMYDEYNTPFSVTIIDHHVKSVRESPINFRNAHIM